MPKRKNRFMQFISRQANGEVSQSNTAQGFLSSYTFHNLPLNLFIERVVNKTIDPLIKDEFFDSIKDKQGKYIHNLTKEINILNIKYDCIQTSVMYLEKIPGDVEVLAVIKTFIHVNANDSLKVILSRAKRFLDEADAKKSELDKLNIGRDGKEPDHRYFTQLIVSVQQHVGYQINKKETTTAEFAEMINNLIETNEAKIVPIGRSR